MTFKRICKYIVMAFLGAFIGHLIARFSASFVLGLTSDEYSNITTMDYVHSKGGVFPNSPELKTDDIKDKYESYKMLKQICINGFSLLFVGIALYLEQRKKKDILDI